MAEMADSAGYSLAELAQRFELTLRGDAQMRISGVCALAPGKHGHLSFCADPRRHSELAGTLAAAVVLRVRDAQAFAGNALLAADPALAFSRIAELFDPGRRFTPGVHAAAVIEPGAVVGAGCWIGPGAVIETGASIGDGSFIGPHCLVRRGAAIGPDSRLEARVHVGERCRLGARVHVQPGAVIGGRGFGLARSPQGWVETPQLGSVRIGDDVEIGSNTTIDRGALDDTVIEDGVKLDNLIQIAHNCRIGAHTAIAACVGIAGSTVIGRNCMIGGAVGIGGHLNIADGVVLLAGAMVSKSIPASGGYGSVLPALPARDWRKLIGRLRRMEILVQRVERVEQKLKLQPEPGDANEPDDL